MSSKEKQLVLGLPKGSLQESTFMIFKKAGFNIDGSSRSYLPKIDDPDPVFAGNPVIYTLTAKNNGPADASGVIVSDFLPLEVTFNAALSDSRCTGAGLLRAGRATEC